MTSGGELSIVASLALLGLPAERYLTTTDHDERLVLGALGRAAVRQIDVLQRNQAIHIANAFVKARLHG